jgi:hypothetical protein
MPEQKTVRKAKQDKKQGKSASTQAGEFVKEEIEHVRKGKHGARSAKQVIAIGLSKARRAGVEVPAPKAGSKTASAKTKKATKTTVSKTRSRATTTALKKESKTAASKTALSRRAKAAAKKRTPKERSASAKKAARTRKRNKS